MADIDIDKTFLSNIMQNMATALEKTKLVEDRVKNLSEVVFGNENTNKIGLAEAHRQLLKEVSSIKDVLDDDLIALKKAIETVDSHKLTIENRLVTVEEFIKNIKNLPMKLLLLIPLFSLITQVIAQLVLPFFWKTK